MCLGVPGQIVALERDEDFGLATGRVRFGAIEREVNLSFVPDAGVGDYVVVHVGFAISQVDEAEAKETLAYLQEMGQLAEELGDDAMRPLGGGRPR